MGNRKMNLIFLILELKI